MDFEGQIWNNRTPHEQLIMVDAMIEHLESSLSYVEEYRREIINRYGLNDAQKKTKST